jgi:flagellar biosynthesis protein FliQ
MQWMPEAIRDGIIVVLIISGPLVLAAAFIGLVIGVLQAATQVQEQTIGSALKIIGVFALIIFVGFWMYQYLNNYTSRVLTTAFTFVPRQTQKAVPGDAFREEEFKASFEKEKVDLETAQKPLRVEPLAEIETPFEGGGIPPGVPYLGGQGVEQRPEITKLIPPEIPKPPSVQVFKPSIPLAPLQEPKPLQVDEIPNLEGLPAFEEEGAKSIDELNPEETDLQINLVPGEPTTPSSTVESRQIEAQDNGKINPENPSWIN